MNAEELKQKIREIFGLQVRFNKEFDAYAGSIKNIDDNLISWCVSIKEGRIQPITKSILGNSIVFIKKIGSSNRCIIIKIKMGEFREVHLGDHDYYDELTARLGLKKSGKGF